MDEAKNRMKYLIWLRTNYPAVYRAAMQRTMAGMAGSGISGLGSMGSISDWANAFSDLIKNVASVVTTYTTSMTDVELVTANTSRINKGLGPLNKDGSAMTDAQMRAAGYSDASIATIDANLAKSGTSSSSVSTSTLLIADG